MTDDGTEESTPHLSRRLADRFGIVSPGQGPTADVVRILYDALRRPSNTAADRFDQWHRLYADGHGEGAIESAADSDELASHLGIDPEDPTRLLFALHTGFALLVKLITLRLVRDIDGGEVTDIRTLFQSLETDAFWRKHSITGFLDDDLFDWYLDGWSDDLASALDDLLVGLRDCDTDS